MATSGTASAASPSSSITCGQCGHARMPFRSQEGRARAIAPDCKASRPHGRMCSRPVGTPLHLAIAIQILAQAFPGIPESSGICAAILVRAALAELGAGLGACWIGLGTLFGIELARVHSPASEGAHSRGSGVLEGRI